MQMLRKSWKCFKQQGAFSPLFIYYNMKLNTTLSHEAEYIGDIQENRVGIDKNNIDFIASLLTSNLYSKPLQSFLRETVANAYDSHVEAGSKDPILLLIEDNNKEYSSYTISVRDYGVGVSPERFDKIYRNIGSSTKRESNDYIGMFGIGRFAALSCANAANINSYYHGVKYSYIMYKNGSGINIDRIAETKGDFKDGLEVSITKKIYSTSDFQEAIEKLCLFDNLYVKYVGNNSSIRYAVDKFNNRKVIHCNTFSLCPTLYHYKNYFKVGNVLYENNSTFDLDSKSGMIIDLPIGTVDITPNREELQYTDYTLNTIKDRVSMVKSELQERINKLILNDMTLNEFFMTFCDGSCYSMQIDEFPLNISRSDVNLDYHKIKIGGEEIPRGFDQFLDDVSRISIDKSYISKTLNKTYRSPYISIGALLRNHWILCQKLDPTTKSVTWNYTIQNAKGSTVILNFGAFGTLQSAVKNRKSLWRVNDYDNDKCTEFMFRHLKTVTMSNSDVPQDFIDAFKNENKSKKQSKKDTSQVPIRLYHSNGYTISELNHIPKKSRGLILYDQNTKDDSALRALANVFGGHSNIARIISLKKEDISLVEHDRKFMAINDFFFKRNKIFEKIATAKIIRKNLDKQIPNETLLPTIRRNFSRMYSNELICLNCLYMDGSNLISNTVDKYIEKGWVDKCAIAYYNFSKCDIEAANMWKKLYDNKEKIIQMIVYKMFGQLPKISLIPVAIPSDISSLLQINKKTNESIQDAKLLPS